jgi:L-seryl-tRNA(Ser) seleniumtransferase
VVVQAIRDEIARARTSPARFDPQHLARCAADRLARLDQARPRRTINATGVVIHTNLGRAPLDHAVGLIAAAATGYGDLEFDLVTGQRGKRIAMVRDSFALLFPQHAALVVNNNAAALMLALNTLAKGREVIISRGELVEIGGSFRVPEVLEASDCQLHEVGTTNRTHLKDYQAAIGPHTAALLRVWPSNYRVIGFTKQVSIAELSNLARQHTLPLIADQGCGRLLDESPGPITEPSVESLLRDGAELVCCSGDKLLGGPQAGLLIGKPELIEAAARNPMMRALRPDKLILAALAATLREHLAVHNTTPTARMLTRDEAALQTEAAELARRIGENAPRLQVEVRRASSRVGGGAAPEEDLPTWVVAVSDPQRTPDRLMHDLRAAPTPVIARIENDRVVFDPRTLQREEFTEIASALA